MNHAYILQTQRGVNNLYLVDAPPTGFKATKNPLKATRFQNQEAVAAYRKERGVFNCFVLTLVRVGRRWRLVD